MQAPVHDLPQTRAMIFCEEWYAPSTQTLNGSGQFVDPRRRRVGSQIDSATRKQFENTVGFTYTNDVMNLGDPFTFSVPNADGRYNGRFQRGARVELHLQNAAVRGDQLTLKHFGIVINRTMRADPSGCYLDIQCADLGWHLRENDAPLWYRLQGGTLLSLVTDPTFIDPSWGIRTDVLAVGAQQAEVTNRLRQSLNNSRAQAAIDLQALPSVVYIQVEPGDKVADLIQTYCRRKNLLFTVTPDRLLQFWLPDYTRKPLYSITLHKYSETERQQNTVISCAITEDVSQIWTDVTCIGEMVGQEAAPDGSDQNATKRRGTFVNAGALPFVHRMGFADGDIFDRSAAQKQAKWRWQRGVYDSWTANYTVRGHWARQPGTGEAFWWEADTLVQVNDTVHGLDGTFYVGAVTYTRDQRGDITLLSLKYVDLLSASFGVFPAANIPKAPPITPTATEGTTIVTNVTRNG